MQKTFFALVFALASLCLAAQTPDNLIVSGGGRGQFCSTTSGLAKAWWQKGNDHFMSGDLEDAVVFFRKSAEADSNFCDPCHGLSIAYASLQKLDSAEFFSRRAFALNQSDRLKFNLATTLGMRSKYDEAIPLLEQLLKTEFQKATVHQSLAQMYLFRERFDEAIAQAEASLALCEKTDPVAAATDYLIIGSAWLWQQKPEQAKPFLEKAIELGANVPESYRKAAGMN